MSKEGKTPRTTVKDFLQSVHTEKNAERTLRRRSVAEDPSAKPWPGSASKKPGPPLATSSPAARSSPWVRRSTRGSIGGEEDVVITPRHLIQNMLTVQGTAQPISRRQRRVSDMAMRPPTSASARKVARRRSSVSGLDLSDVTRKFTPRTNILGFLDQASEMTPALRQVAATATDSHSKSHSTSYFTVNEVGVSLLERNSSAVMNVSASGLRFKGKRRNLNIQLPEATPPKRSMTPRSAKRTAADVSTSDADENLGGTASPQVIPPTQTEDGEVSSPLVQPDEEVVPPTQQEDSEDPAETVTDTSRSNVSTRGFVPNTSAKSDADEEVIPPTQPEDSEDPAEISVADTSRANVSTRGSALKNTSATPDADRSGERNVFSDLFGEGAGDGGGGGGGGGGGEEVSAGPQRSRAEPELVQGGPKAPTPSTSDRSRDSTRKSLLRGGTPRRGDSQDTASSHQATLDVLWSTPQGKAQTPGGSSVRSNKSSLVADSGSAHVRRLSKRSLEHVADASPASSSGEKRARRSLSSVSQNLTAANGSRESTPLRAGQVSVTTSGERTPLSYSQASVPLSGRSRDGTPQSSGLARNTPGGSGSAQQRGTPGSSASGLQRNTPGSPTSAQRRDTPGSSVSGSRRTSPRGLTSARDTPRSAASAQERNTPSGLASAQRRDAPGQRNTPSRLASAQRRDTPGSSASGLRRTSPRSPALAQQRDTPGSSASGLKRNAPKSPTSAQRRDTPGTSVSAQRRNAPSSVGGGSTRGKSPTETRHGLSGMSDNAKHGSSQKRSRSSVISRLSGRFDALAGSEGGQPSVLDLDQNYTSDPSVSVFAEAPSSSTVQLDSPALEQMQDEDSDSFEEEDGYSPLKTPYLPVTQRTPSTVVASKVAQRNSSSVTAAGPRVKNTRRAASTTGRAGRKTKEGLPTKDIKTLFSHFCQLRVSKEAIEEVEEMSQHYWRNLGRDLEAFAEHAHRRTINISDFELLMKRQGFITDTCSLNTLIAKYLPLELRQTLIPIARSGNRLEPKV